MRNATKDALVERSVMVLEVFGVVVAYFGILAILSYPVLAAAGYLA